MPKKFLDADGVTQLVSLLDNYPDNEVLSAVIDAIQDTLDEAMFKKALNTCSPAEIQEIITKGFASLYWSIGDETAAITIDSFANFAGATVSAYIIGFDHNKSIEGEGVTFQLGRINEIDTALVDSGYGTSKTSGTWFNINNNDTNVGGWNSSIIYTTLLPTLLNALPTAWKNVIVETTKYTDNIGGGSDTASNVTTTSDKLFLLAEYEVFGSRSYANSAEQTYQAQYAYYANGGSKIKYKHNATFSACDWWLRSPHSDNSNAFCGVSVDGSVTASNASYCIGLAPAFRITTGTIRVDLVDKIKLTNAASAATETSGRVYPVALDKNGKLAVNVPWTDTTYESKNAAYNGTAVSLVTTGEKYFWNNNKASSIHTHGNITSAGQLQTIDITIETNDKLVVTDASNNNKIARTTIVFDGSTDNMALTKKGTFEKFIRNKPLNTCSPTEIQEIITKGLASLYWSIGDVTQSISINAFTNFAGATVNAYIIGFDHNKDIEGEGVTFQIGRLVNRDVALVDSGFDSLKTSGVWFNMNSNSANTGGWQNSQMRTTILLNLLNALPSDWKNVIAETTKYTDNIGGGSTAASNVTTTNDKLFLLSEWEVFGSRTNANNAEQNYQQQYAYYTNGGNKIKYKYNSTTTACPWWLRSTAAINSSVPWCMVRNTGATDAAHCSASYGVSPAFRIAPPSDTITNAQIDALFA